ncbi:MAG: hypothetical protein EP332_04695 [Bacteroidetes bacterium]|nr:MAG: hypothetical protein EP332_04695 [Bacteroidota bacterium]
MKYLDSSILLLGLVLMGCGKIKPQDFVNQVNDPKGNFCSLHEFENQNIMLSTVFKPAEFNALMGLESEQDYEDQFKLALNEQESSLRFDFRIACLDPSYDIIKDTLPPDLYIERIEYLTAKMAGDFSLVMGKDTIVPNFFHYERTYNMTPFNNFLLGFDLPRSKVHDNIRILYDDKLFGLGRIEFDFDKNTINQKYPIDL